METSRQISDPTRRAAYEMLYDFERQVGAPGATPLVADGFLVAL